MPDTILYAPDGVTQASFPDDKVQTALDSGFTRAGETSVAGHTISAQPTPPSDLPSTTPEEAAAQPKIGKTSVRNLNTGLIEDLPVDQAEVGLIKGTHEVPDPEEHMRILDTQSNSMYEVPAGKIKDLITGSNGRIKIADIYDVEKQQLAQAEAKSKAEAEAHGIVIPTTSFTLPPVGVPMSGPGPFNVDTGPGLEVSHKALQKLDVALAGAGQGVPLASVMEAIHQQDIAGHPEAQAHAKGIQDYLEAHPAAYYSGRIPSEIANLYVTGGAAGLVGAGVKAAGLGTAGKILSEGLAYGLEPAAANAINKDYKGAAEALALGALGNVAIHGAFSALEKAPIALAEMTNKGTEAAGVASEEATKTMVEQMGIKGAEAETMQRQMKRLVDEGIVKEGTAQENIENIKNELSKPKVSQAISQLDQAPGAGNLISDQLQSAKSAIFDLAKQNLGEAQKEIQKALTPMVKQIDAVIQQPTFQNLADTERFLAEKVGEQPTAVNQAKQKVLDIFRQTKTNLENQIADQLGKPSIIQTLSEERANKAILEIMENAVSKDKPAATLKSTFQDILQHPIRHGALPMVLHALGVPHLLSVPIGMAARSIVDRLTSAGADASFVSAFKKYNDNAVRATAKAVQAQELKIAQSVKDTLGSFAAQSVVKYVPDRQAVNNFLPNNGVGLSQEQKMAALRKNITSILSNPENTANHLSDLTSPLHEVGMSPVAQAYNEHQLRLMKVIETFLPKDNSILQEAHPFSATVEKKDISEATMTRFNRVMSVAADPHVLFEMMKANTITPGDVAIAAATNPENLTQMRTEMLNEAMKNKPDLSYQQRLSLGYFMGTNLDASTTQLPILQSIYGEGPPMAPVAMPGSPAKAHMKDKTGQEIVNAVLTPSQKANKGL